MPKVLWSWLCTLLVAVLPLALSSLCAAQAPSTKTAAVVPPPQPPFFVIGVWYQPIYSFEKWKKRGINTMLGYEHQSRSVPFDKWRQELEKHDLYTIRKPEGEPTEDAKDPRLLAWKFDDEPDLQDNRGKVGFDPATLLKQYHALKAAAPTKPILVNFSGGEVRGAWQKGGEAKEKYAAYCRAADWISQDLYPITGWVRPDWIDLSLPIALPSQREPERYTEGWTLDRLRELSGGKAQFSILECSNQNLPWLPADKRRSVTPDEFRGQVWHSIIHGAVGISYFPQQIGGGFKYDVMTPEVEAEMIAQNQKIKELSPILLAPGERLESAAPFEVATRRHNGKTYTFVLNFSSKPATYQGQTFTPYEIKINQ